MLTRFHRIGQGKVEDSASKRFNRVGKTLWCLAVKPEASYLGGVEGGEALIVDLV